MFESSLKNIKVIASFKDELIVHGEFFTYPAYEPCELRLNRNHNDEWYLRDLLLLNKQTNNYEFVTNMYSPSLLTTIQQDALLTII